jgi:hypothetical protein
MAGVPTVVTDFGSIEFVPDELVLKVKPGESEAFQLSQIFLTASQQMISAEQVKKYAAELYDVSTVATELSMALKRVVSDKQFAAKWSSLEEEARAALYAEACTLRSGDQMLQRSDLAAIFSGLGWS